MSDLDHLPPSIRDHVMVTVECWWWTGNLRTDGYTPAIRIGDKRYPSVHRAVWSILNGPIPVGMTCDHICHDPATCAGGPTCPHRACVNPAHIKLVAHAQNLLAGRNANSRSVAERVSVLGTGDGATHCPQGHRYTEDNVYWSRNKSRATGWQRKCRMCTTRRERERYEEDLERKRLASSERQRRYYEKHLRWSYE